VDISTLSSDEGFRTINVGTGDVFTSTGEAVGEAIKQGYFTPPTSGAYVPKPWQEIEAEWRKNAGLHDEDRGGYPGRGNPAALEFTVTRGVPTDGTSDISPINPQFAGTANVNITPATMWDEAATEWWGAFGPPAVDTIKSTVPVLAETAPAWSGGDNWWDEG